MHVILSLLSKRVLCQILVSEALTNFFAFYLLVCDGKR